MTHSCAVLGLLALLVGGCSGTPGSVTVDVTIKGHESSVDLAVDAAGISAAASDACDHEPNLLGKLLGVRAPSHAIVNTTGENGEQSTVTFDCKTGEIVGN